MKYPLVILSCFVSFLSAQCPPCTNQTSYFTTPLSEEGLPFQIRVETADFSLPTGLHSFAFAIYKGEWLLLSGRTNGLHNVDNTDPSPEANSFPRSSQNTILYVINPQTKTIYSRSLHDPESSLAQAHIDLLSVTNSIFYQTQNKKTLYLVGGYGIDSATGTMGTKPAMTAIDVPALIQWVKRKKPGKTALDCMRFAFHPLLQITGGVMSQTNPHQPYLLVFGQNFAGYYVQESSGSYTNQIRCCQILDNGRDLFIQPYPAEAPLDVYRRRDLNVVPVIKKVGKSYEHALVALSGVFTPGGDDTPGAWTIPVEIQGNGSSKMLDDTNPSTFSQAMNNYTCANVGLYSQKSNRMYTTLFGGISSVILSTDDCDNQCQTNIPAEGNVFIQCCNLPFVNDITTIEIDPKGVYRQYLMSTKFPTIEVSPPPETCPGGPFPPTSPRIYWFGAASAFFPEESLPRYSNGVIAFDKLSSSPTFIGYVVGGIASNITDTNCAADSAPSTYIFKVTLIPR